MAHRLIQGLCLHTGLHLHTAPPYVPLGAHCPALKSESFVYLVTTKSSIYLNGSMLSFGNIKMILALLSFLWKGIFSRLEHSSTQDSRQLTPAYPRASEAPALSSG